MKKSDLIRGNAINRIIEEIKVTIRKIEAGEVLIKSDYNVLEEKIKTLFKTKLEELELALEKL